MGLSNSPTSSSSIVRSLTTCVVGGGNSALILIPLLAEAGHNVKILTRRPEDWHEVVYCEITDGLSGKVEQTHCGRLSMKSADPSEVIPGADIVILCLPVHQYRPALNKIAPFISRDKEVFVGTVFGQGGFNWMVHNDIENQFDLHNIVAFAIGNIPWICRCIEYGKVGACYGAKVVNVVAVSPNARFNKLDQVLLHDISFRPFGHGKFRLANSFISLSLSVDNQIIHPSRCYGLYKKFGGEWPSMKEVPYFYRDFDQESADNILKMDTDYTAIRSAIKKHFPNRSFPYMLSYLELEKLNHASCHDDILASFRDSVQLAAIKTPVVEDKESGTFTLNIDCRFFTDDIPYGLVIAKWIAEKLNVKTPFIDDVITWAQTLRGEHFLDENKMLDIEYCLTDKFTSGIPESYGITSVEDILD